MNQGDSQFGGHAGGLNGNGGSSSSSSSSQVNISHKNNSQKLFCCWFTPLSITDIKSRQIYVFHVVVMVPVEDRIVLGVADCPSILVLSISEHSECQNRLGSAHDIALNQSGITMTKMTQNVKMHIVSASCPFITFRVVSMIYTILCYWWKAVTMLANTYFGQNGSFEGIPEHCRKVGDLTSANHVYGYPDSLWCCLIDATIPYIHHNMFTSRKMTFNVVFTYRIWIQGVFLVGKWGNQLYDPMVSSYNGTVVRHLLHLINHYQ